MKFFNMFKKNRERKSGFESLNNSCNSAFEAVFNKCRLVFGNEMVQMMDKKTKLVDSAKNNVCTASQELILKKFIELFTMYLRVIELYVSIKNSGCSGEKDHSTLETMEEKINKVYNLLKELNSQFYLASEAAGISECDEMISEAEALRNVIRENYIRFKNYD